MVDSKDVDSPEPDASPEILAALGSISRRRFVVAKERGDIVELLKLLGGGFQILSRKIAEQGNVAEVPRDKARFRK